MKKQIVKSQTHSIATFTLTAVAAITLLTALTSCSSLNVEREPAGKKERAMSPAFEGLRVNPVTEVPESEWEVELHNGDRNEWQLGNLHTEKWPAASADQRSLLVTRLRAIKERGSKDARHALEEAMVLLDLVDNSSTSAKDRRDAFVHAQEAIAAFNLDFRSPVPLETWIVAAPVVFADAYLGHAIMTRESHEASNLSPHAANADLSRVDPVASSFWQPRNLRSVDFYNGFGRNSIPNVTSAPCRYTGPKKSYGVHGGFTMTCDSERWKLKFGDESSVEPFVGRLVWALGYHASPVDFVSGVRVTYDRHLLTEFNSRKDMEMRAVSLTGFTYAKINLQREHDPFTYAIKGANMKDGSFVSSAVLRSRLMKNLPAKVVWKELTDANFESSVENQIREFVMLDGSIETGEDKNEELGPWSFGDLDHRSRRETRAFGVVAALVNLFDTRPDNNKLFVHVNERGGRELHHYVSDLGGALGRAEGATRYSVNKLSDFPWSFFQARPASIETGTGSQRTVMKQVPFAFHNYSTAEANEAFERVQLNDVKWIARRLAALTDAQIKDAAIGSGYDAVETKMLVEKLAARRKELIGVLGLGSEFPALMSRPIDHHFNYDPRTATPLATSDRRHTVRASNRKIVNGEIVGSTGASASGQ